MRTSAHSCEVISFSRERLKAAARRSLNLRLLRAKMFGSAISREVAWDILLSLFNHDQRLTVGKLTRAVNAPCTTVLRWLDYLDDRKLIRRYEDPADRGSVYVELDQKAGKLLELYLVKTLSTQDGRTAF